VERSPLSMFSCLCCCCVCFMLGFIALLLRCIRALSVSRLFLPTTVSSSINLLYFLYSSYPPPTFHLSYPLQPPSPSPFLVRPFLFALVHLSSSLKCPRNLSCSCYSDNSPCTTVGMLW
jgi:hypothetical protein